MNSNGQNFKLTSGNSLFYYGSYEYCYWGVYAPGAQTLRFELLDDLEVSEIFLYIIDIAGRINKSSLHFDQIGSYKKLLKISDRQWLRLPQCASWCWHRRIPCIAIL